MSIIETVFTVAGAFIGLTALGIGIYLYQEKSVTQKTRIIFSVILFFGLLAFLMICSLVKSNSPDNSAMSFWDIFWEYLKMWNIIGGFLLIIIMPVFYHFYRRKII
jgi:hypothetical protein